MTYMTVGKVRSAIKDLPDDMLILIEDAEWGPDCYTKCAKIKRKTLMVDPDHNKVIEEKMEALCFYTATVSKDYREAK